MQFIFNNSLPRSGSTLLQRILSQNPKIYASPTSPLVDVLINFRNSWSQFLEMRAIEHTGFPQKTLPKVLKAIVEAYYSDFSNKIICDKSRGHTAIFDLWQSILGYIPKTIVCFRDLPSILSSIEKLYRKTGLIKQPPFEKEYYYQMQTLDGRCTIWTAAEQIVGLSMSRTMEAITRYPEYLHFVNYDKLTKYPESTMKKIYKFIEEDYFEHDFNNIPTENLENDNVHGWLSLHSTRSKVEYKPSDARQILGNDLYNKYSAFSLDILFPDIDG